MNNALAEKQAVRDMVGDLVVQVLWHSKVHAAEGDTEVHHVKVWKEKGVVFAEVKKVR